MLYRTYSCCIGHIYVYRTQIEHIYVISDIFMLYRSYLSLSDTNRTYLCFIGHIIPDIFVISDIFILRRTYFFYRTYLYSIEHICVLWDTYYIGRIYGISGTRFIGCIYVLSGHIYWTHISDIFMCCKGLNNILY